MSESDVMEIFVWLLFIGGFLFFVIFRRMRKTGIDKRRPFQISEEALSESFLMLSVLFFGVTLLSFNSNLREPLSWRTILLLTSGIGILYAYVFRIVSPLLFGLIVFMCWWTVQAWEWTEAEKTRPAGVVLGLAIIGPLFYLVGRLHERRQRFGVFAQVYAGLGLVLISLILFFFSTSMGLEFLQDMTTGSSFVASWKIMFSLALLFALFGAAHFLAYRESRLALAENMALNLFIVLFGIISFLPIMQEVFLVDRYSRSALTSTGIAWAVLFNALSFLQLLGLILMGYRRQDERLVNAGVLFLFIFIAVKYADWFFRFLDKSVFFIGAGILLFVVGWLMERGRRYMLSSLR
jgi:uncharacterized membrane protein